LQTGSAVLAAATNVTERKMFGGLAVMVSGKLACGIVGPDLMLRLGDEGANSALEEPHVRPMDFTHRPRRSMVYVGPAGVETDQALRRWAEQAVDFASGLPPK
jgi:TfoX/Sxy family transcriptional regulator of competence genes